MTLARLLNQDVVIVHPAVIDDNGDVIHSFGADAERVPTRGRLQRRSTTEVIDGREAQVSEWVLFLDGCEEISGLDQVEWRHRAFVVAGEPYPVTGRSGAVHHWEVPLRRVAG